MLLEVKHISKSFPGVKALEDINLSVDKGEVLCIAGENGAGKSTLIKVLSGIYIPEEGEIWFDGKKCDFSGPTDSLAAGISVVHQEHKLLENLTVAENIYFGRFPMRKGLVDYKKLFSDADAIINKLQLSINSHDLVSTLTSSQSQMVEIAKAYSRDAKLMILDEPSSSITDSEVEVLLDLINRLKAEGKAFIYVSHKLQEMFVVGDSIAVFKDGHHVATRKASELNVDSIVALMIGRDIGKVFRPKDRPIGEELLRVEELSNDKVSNISFSIHSGEIVGFAGLVGAGRSEVAESIFGCRDMRSGKIFINGEEVHIKRPRDAIDHKIAFVTEDRKKTGAIQVKSVGINISLANLSKYCHFGFIDKKAEHEAVSLGIEELKIKTPNAEQEVQFLSGGNQQKVILAKWLLTNSRILICDEPTKGIDVGTKQEFYNILDDLARQGVGIMLISSDITEIIGLSNRVVVMRNGHFRAELSGDQITEETIAEYSMKD